MYEHGANDSPKVHFPKVTSIVACAVLIADPYSTLIPESFAKFSKTES